MRQAEVKRLKVQIRKKRAIINQLHTSCYLKYQDYAAAVHNEEFQYALIVLYQKLHANYKRINAVHMKKIWHLRRQSGNPAPPPSVCTLPYINLSSKNLTNEQQAALQRGGKYAYPPLDHKTIIRSLPDIENIISKMPKHAQEKTRQVVAHKISSFTECMQNKTQKQEQRALLELKKDPNIVITKDDKSPKMVILNRLDYDMKITEALSSIEYSRVKKDPTNALLRKLAEYKNHSALPVQLRDKCKPPIAPSVPRLFGTIKMHKQGSPARLLVSKTCAPTIQIERALAQYLKPYISKTCYTALNAIEALNAIKSIRTINPSSILATLDVKNLYPSTPTHEAIGILINRLYENQTIPTQEIVEIERLLKFLNMSNYFIFREQIYLQKTGTPMGSPISAVLAECILQEIEKIVLNTTKNKPELYLRYIDDVLIIWNHPQEDLNVLQQELSSVYQSITFLQEIETNNEIAFLDIMIRRHPYHLETAVYRKATYVPAVIPSTSHHPKNQKLAAFYSFLNRLFTHCSTPIYYKRELEWILQVARRHGYHVHEIYRILNKIKCQSEIALTAIRKEKPRYLASVPYLGTITNSIMNNCRPLGLSFGTRAVNIFKTLRNDKDPISVLNRSGVYHIPLPQFNNTGPSGYIGSTRRAFINRIKEHKIDIQKKKVTTAMAKYCAENSIEPLWNSASMIQDIHQTSILYFTEAMYIYLYQDRVCNDEAPVLLPCVWTYILDRLKGKVLPPSHI